MQQRILFLCTGNYYRSRFAEELFNHRAAAHQLPWIADSRALAIERGMFNIGPLSPHTAVALTQRGISVREPVRPPKPLAEADLVSSDHIVALKEAEHRPLMQQRFPEWVDRVEYWHIHDLDRATASEAIAEIEEHVTSLLKRLTAQEADSQHQSARDRRAAED